MKLILTSKNPAKEEAVRRVFSASFPDLEIVAVEVESNVSQTPTTDEEGIQGCLNRIDNAKSHSTDADFILGLEGIVTKNKFGTYLCGWAVIYDCSKERQSIGCSAKVQIPPFIADKIESNSQLSDLVKAIYPSEFVDQLKEIGTNGLITHGLYPRSKEFEDALTCAWGYMLNEENYQ